MSRVLLRVFSAICSNLVAGWLIIVFATNDPLTKVANLLYAGVAWYLAVRTEEMTER